MPPAAFSPFTSSSESQSIWHIHATSVPSKTAFFFWHWILSSCPGSSVLMTASLLYEANSPFSVSFWLSLCDYFPSSPLKTIFFLLPSAHVSSSHQMKANFIHFQDLPEPIILSYTIYAFSHLQQDHHATFHQTPDTFSNIFCSFFYAVSQRQGHPASYRIDLSNPSPQTPFAFKQKWNLAVLEALDVQNWCSMRSCSVSLSWLFHLSGSTGGLLSRPHWAKYLAQGLFFCLLFWVSELQNWEVLLTDESAVNCWPLCTGKE